MSQHDYVIANGTGAAVRADINDALSAVVSLNSGAAEPSTLFANMIWIDTTLSLAKKRDNASANWRTFADKDFTRWLLGDGTVAAPAYSFNADDDNGMYRIGVNNYGFAAAGAKVLDISATGLGVTGTIIASSNIKPSANDGASLGISGTAFSDLFLASGAILDFNAGNVVLTHSAGILTLGTGEIRITTPGTNSASVPTLGSTSTLTNKRITPRVGSVASSATPTINTDNVDAFKVTALAAAITSFTTNLTGTPNDFDKLVIRIKDDGTARAITWGASFEAKGVALPTTTVISKVLTVGFIYDSVSAKWGCVASAQEA